MFYWTRKCRYFNQLAASVTLVLTPPIPEYRIHNITTVWCIPIYIMCNIIFYTQYNSTIRIMCAVAISQCVYCTLYIRV